MSKKDVDKYFKKITDDYSEMLATLKDMEEASANQLVNPEQVSQLETMVDKLKDNYMRWSYMMYLLNQPARKEKIPAYKKRLEKAFKNKSPEELVKKDLDENRSCINDLKNKISKI